MAVSEHGNGIDFQEFFPGLNRTLFIIEIVQQNNAFEGIGACFLLKKGGEINFSQDITRYKSRPEKPERKYFEVSDKISKKSIPFIKNRNPGACLITDQFKDIIGNLLRRVMVAGVSKIKVTKIKAT